MPLSSDNNSLNFRVRDAQGNWYYFEKGDVSRRAYPIPGSQGETELKYTSRWVISKVVQNNGQEINYQYNNVEIYNTGTGNSNMYHSFTALERSGAPVPVGTTIGSGEQYWSIKTLASISYPNNVVAVAT